MHTFHQITQYVFNKKVPIAYLDGTFDKNNDFLQAIYNEKSFDQFVPKTATVKQMFFMYMLSNKYGVISKFRFLNEIFENVIASTELQEEFLNYFCKIQRIYFFLAKRAHRFKMRKTITQTSTDMYMNPLDENDYKTFSFIQHGKKYYFSASDLINIINSSLSNTSYFFAEPLVCKNPYNNIPFNKSTLYNIYFFLRKTDYIMPLLFNYYFLENFNIKKFAEKHEWLIREKSIKRFVDKSTDNELYSEIMKMLGVHSFARRLKIDPSFPKNRLVIIMRPYLELYYLYTCSTDLIKRDVYEKEFNDKMINFYLYNKKFGRKYYNKKVIQSNPFTYPPAYKYVVSYDDGHLMFNNADEELRDFKNSHIHITTLNDYVNYRDEESTDTGSDVEDEREDEDEYER